MRTTRPTRATRATLGWLAPLLLLASLGCHARPKASLPPACAAATLVASRVATPPKINGELHEEGWLRTARTPPLVDDAEPHTIVPHSEVRALWDDDALYLSFYAADEDLRATDFVGTALDSPGGLLELEISPGGTLTCRQATHVVDCGTLAGVHAAADTDGTIDDPRDDDEEWTVELVIPWRVLGLARPPHDLPIAFARRDQPKQAPLRHLVWTPGCPAGKQGTLRLE